MTLVIRLSLVVAVLQERGLIQFGCHGKDACAVETFLGSQAQELGNVIWRAV
jgi:hypothetical protein